LPPFAGFWFEAIAGTKIDRRNRRIRARGVYPIDCNGIDGRVLVTVKDDRFRLLQE
jgi:hypothetical protein